MEENQVSPTEVTSSLDSILDGGNERLLEVYLQLDDADDNAVMLAELMTGMHKFSWALNTSNAINGRQGKNRIVINPEQRQLMKYFNDENIDSFIDDKANELFNYVISTYLLDKYNISGSSQDADRKMKRAKTLYIMLFSSQQYNTIRAIKTPEYLVDVVNRVFEYLFDEQDEIYYDFIEYLESHEAPEVAQLASSLGQDIWGSDRMNPGPIFTQIFRELIPKFYDYDATYAAYLEFRGRYLKVTRNITKKSLCEMFDISEDTIQKQRRCILDEISEIFNENESAIAIRKLIFGS